MSFVGHFALFNLLPSIVAGFLLWLAVVAAVTLLRIRYAPLRLCLFGFPLVKSVLLLLGMGTVFPWPQGFFGYWHSQALSAAKVWPLVLLWAGLALAWRAWLRARARQLALQDTRLAAEVSPRLSRALAQVREACRRKPPAGGWTWCVGASRPALRLLVAQRPLASPFVVHAGKIPELVFPAHLIPRLDDGELAGALAHELAHLTLRRPRWFPTVCWWLMTISPIAALLSRQFHREEERACDEMAVATLGQPEVYAQMLLKSYRGACEVGPRSLVRLRAWSHLLGFGPKGTLSARIENILSSDTTLGNLGAQRWAACLLGFALFLAM